MMNPTIVRENAYVTGFANGMFTVRYGDDIKNVELVSISSLDGIKLGDTGKLMFWGSHWTFERDRDIDEFIFLHCKRSGIKVDEGIFNQFTRGFPRFGYDENVVRNTIDHAATVYKLRSK